jgi:hypothetical protein
MFRRELAAREKEPTVLFDVDLGVAIDHDLAHLVSFEKWKKRGKERSDGLIENVTGDAQGASSIVELPSLGYRTSWGPVDNAQTSVSTDLTSGA